MLSKEKDIEDIKELLIEIRDLLEEQALCRVPRPVKTVRGMRAKLRGVSNGK